MSHDPRENGVLALLVKIIGSHHVLGLGLCWSIAGVAMTRPDLTAIQQRADAATEGPWRAHRHRLFVCKEDGSPATGMSVGAWPGVGSTHLEQDAEFCAAARTDIPALLAYVAELEAVRDSYERHLAAFGTEPPWREP